MGIPDLRIQLYLDSANLDDIRKYGPMVQGFTTNPSLMRQAGATDYESFIRQVLAATEPKPVSFEVIADDFEEMEAQARELARWSTRIYVKIPITNSRGESSARLMGNLRMAGVKVNATAVMLDSQVDDALRARPSIISIFAGRMADTGVDPRPLCEKASYSGHAPLWREPTRVLWASARQVFDVRLAAQSGCDIITLTPALLDKLSLYGKDLTDYSRETVQQFYDDALISGLRLPGSRLKQPV